MTKENLDEIYINSGPLRRSVTRGTLSQGGGRVMETKTTEAVSFNPAVPITLQTQVGHSTSVCFFTISDVD